MAAHGMPPGDAGQSWMTAYAEFIDRFMKHELIIGGMRIVAGYAARAVNDAVNYRYRAILLHQIFLVAVAGHTQCGRAVCPELMAIFIPMGIMAYSTPPDVQGSVHIFPGPPDLFPRMAGKTFILEPTGGKTYTPRFNKLLMAGEAEIICRGAMLPFGLLKDIRMADSTGILSFEPHRIDGCGLVQIMAVTAALGQLVSPVKEVDILAQRIRGHIGLQGLVTEIEPLAGRQNGEDIHPCFERQPEMQVFIALKLMAFSRLDFSVICFHPHLVPSIAHRPAQDKMGLRISGGDRGACLRSKDFHLGGPNRASGQKAFEDKKG
jgi:hypothetical protein